MKSIIFFLSLLCFFQISASVLGSDYNFERSLNNYWQGDTARSYSDKSIFIGDIDISLLSVGKSEHNIFRFALHDLKDAVLSPIRWKKKDWKKFGVLAASTGVLIMLDDNIYQQIQDIRTPTTDHITTYALEPFGNYASYGLLAGMFSYGLITGKSKPQETALLAAESYIVTGLITIIPKTLAGRSRPYANDPPDHLEWRGFGGGKSFWSGHTATAFSVASVIASMYNDKRSIQIIAYSTAALTGLSRIHDEKHWSSDVIVGALVGTAIGHLIVHNYRSRTLKVTPIINPELQSLHISYTF